MTKEELKHNNAICRKEFMKERVWSGIPVGLLGYVDNEPMAWCSVAPRESYRRLDGAEELEKVWSIACFYIKKEFRGRGVSKELIEKAKEYAKSSGAEYLEAYPVNQDSPSYRFMGFVSLFEKAGFTHVKMAGTRRHVMILKL
jgi:GNAT superfamily N-acetyltransferase